MTGLKQEKDTMLHIPASDLAVIHALKEAYKVSEQRDGNKHEWRVSTPLSENQKALATGRSKWKVVSKDGEVYLLQSLRTLREESERDKPLILNDGTALDPNEFVGRHYLLKTEGSNNISGHIPNDAGLYWMALMDIGKTLAWNERNPKNLLDISTVSVETLERYSFNKESKVKQDGRETNVEIPVGELQSWVKIYSKRVGEEYSTTNVEGNRSSIEG